MLVHSRGLTLGSSLPNQVKISVKKFSPALFKLFLGLTVVIGLAAGGLVRAAHALPDSATADGYTVNFLGNFFDGTNTTYEYRVCGTGKTPELKHFTIGVPTCGPSAYLIATEPAHGGIYSVDPKPPYPTNRFSRDPLTGIYGVRFSSVLGKSECRNYKITLNGERGLGVVPFAVTAGPSLADRLSEITGAACYASAGECRLTQGKASRIVIMVDKSSSTKPLDVYRQYGAIRALWVYFAKLNPRPYIAVGSYNTVDDNDPTQSARINIPLTQDYGPAHPELNDVLLGMFGNSGATDVGAALDVAKEHLQSFDNGEPGYVVLMSDGVPNRPGSPTYTACDACGCSSAYNAGQNAAEQISSSVGTVVAIHFNTTGFDCSGAGEPADGIAYMLNQIASSSDWYFSGEPSLYSSMIEAGQKIICDDANPCTDNICTTTGCLAIPIHPEDPTASVASACNVAGQVGACAVGSYNLQCQCQQTTFPTDENPLSGGPGVCSDGIDNDCDGTADSADASCIECVGDSTYQEACSTGLAGACAAGTKTYSCVGGFYQGGDCVADVQPGQNLEGLGTVGSCADGIDNDCDGNVDAGQESCIPCEPGTTDTQSCSTGLAGVCSAGTALRTCSEGGIWGEYGECVPDIAPASQQESCNNLDDNCDGQVDESFNLGAACATPGIGACQTGGTLSCDEGGGVFCLAQEGSDQTVTPTPEQCNEIDDDCNGSVDDSELCENVNALDCAGVPGGSAVLDQCGVCNGDGTSCLQCQNYNILAQQFGLDGFAFRQKAIVDSVARRLAKAGTKKAKAQAAKAKALAAELYSKNWHATWQIPQVFNVCGNTTLCVEVDHGNQIDNYIANCTELRKLLRSVVKQTKSLKNTPKKRSEILKRGDAYYQGALDILATIPRASSSCI